MNLGYMRQNVLAHDKVLYAGHAIAGVAATSPHIAEEALSLIEVEYDLLPPVDNVLAAMGGDAPILIDGLKTDEFGQLSDDDSNIAEHFQHKLGDIDKGFEEADEIIEREFNTATVHQG